MTRFAHSKEALAVCEAVALRQLRKLVDFAQVAALEQALRCELRVLAAGGDLGTADPEASTADAAAAAADAADDDDVLAGEARKLLDTAWLRATRELAAAARDRAANPPRVIDRDEPELWS